MISLELAASDILPYLCGRLLLWGLHARQRLARVLQVLVRSRGLHHRIVARTEGKRKHGGLRF